MKTRILSGDDVIALISRVGLDPFMDELISNIAEHCLTFDADKVDMRERDGFHHEHPEIGLLEWMPVMGNKQRATIKIIGYHPKNPLKFQLPTIIGMMGSYDLQTGCTVGIADGTLATALRTAAASGVISKVLAAPDSAVLGIIGCGAQAVTHCHAMLRCFPIRKVLIYDSDPVVQDSFADRIKRFSGAELRVEASTVSNMLANADILCTATSIGVGEGPLFDDEPVNPALHINAVGSDFPGKIELPLSLLEKSLVCPDHREQCIKEGECQQLEPAKIGPSMAEVIQRADHHASFANQLTVFDSTGWAMEDHIVMDMLLDFAREFDIGADIQLHYLPSDPLNPYDF